jgi:tRNA U34 5-carboxymethylaminomethyl modifying GTPase MnmE/TrmE
MKKILALKTRSDRLAQRAVAAPRKPTVAVCGLMNTGKSYLLNMLTQQIDQEYFKTADQRETTINKTLETEQFIYLDTPGLDANTQDDAVAQQGIAEADLVLFVHQPQGELDPSEMAFLRQLKDNFGESAVHSVTLVISKIDKEPAAKIDAIANEIQKQCEEKLGTTFTTFQVSNTRYKTGVSQHKNGLIQASHIDALVQHLQSTIPRIQKARQHKLAAGIAALTADVDVLMQELRDEKIAIQQDIDEQFFPFNAQMKSLQVFLSDSATQFKQI